MYIYCNNCKWTQEDFWNEGYNPFDFMCKESSYKKLLFGGKLDKVIEIEKFDKKLGFIGYEALTNREFLARRVEMWADVIRKQHYITIEQYNEENPEEKCPVCGEKLIED